jgi:hypothetical protein
VWRMECTSPRRWWWRGGARACRQPSSPEAHSSWSRRLLSAALPRGSSSTGAAASPLPLRLVSPTSASLTAAGRFSADRFVDSPQGRTASWPPSMTSTASGRRTPSPTCPPSTRSPSTRCYAMRSASTCSASSRGDLRTRRARRRTTREGGHRWPRDGAGQRHEGQSQWPGVGAMSSEEREYSSSITKRTTLSMNSGIGYRLGLIFR